MSHRQPFLLILLFLLAACSTRTPSTTNQPASSAEEQAFTQARLNMVKDTIEARGVSSQSVLDAMRKVPRHKFVPTESQNQAYEDHPLPIGYGQTISQPYVVAWMTELLDPKPGEKVLEIGTGSGYQAAVLADLEGLDVYSVEIVPELAETASQRLKDLGYTRIHLKQGDGYYGWPEYAPFDAIIVTAAPDHLPSPLINQLAQGGRIVIPIGSPANFQTLWKFVNKGESATSQNDLKAYNLGMVIFVPLTRDGDK